MTSKAAKRPVLLSVLFSFYLVSAWSQSISLSPNAGQRGTSFGVTVTGSNTFFLVNTTTCVQILAQPTNLSLQGVAVQNFTQLSGTLNIPIGHQVGTYDARVYQGPNCSGTQYNCTNCFTITNPACLTVTSTANTGTGSLREAFACASEGDTIRFAPVINNSTILLNTPTIANDKQLVLFNEPNNNVTIGTTLTSTLTVISTNKPLSIFGLKFNGNAPTPLVLKIDPGGSIDFNNSQIDLTNIDKN